MCLFVFRIRGFSGLHNTAGSMFKQRASSAEAASCKTGSWRQTTQIDRTQTSLAMHSNGQLTMSAQLAM